jgi:hypothetical protein
MPKIYEYIAYKGLPDGGQPGQIITLDEFGNKIWSDIIIPENQKQADWNQTDTEALDFIKNKPNIPTELSQLISNSDYRTVSDALISNWNNKADQVHIHEISDITNLQNELDLKAFNDHSHIELHTHDNKSILDKITEVENKPLWNGAAWPGITSLSELLDTNITTPNFNQVLRFNPNTSTWFNSTLDDVYVRPNQEVIFERIFIGDGTTNTDKYIYAHTGVNPIYTSPSLRYKIDNAADKIGHWEFSNDGETFGVIGQSDFIADTKDFDSVAHNDKCVINLLETLDSSYHRIITIYCKEEDIDNPGNFIWIQYPTSPNFEGVGFDVKTYNDRTEVLNLTTVTKNVRIIIQYLAPDVKTNKSDISDVNGLITLWKDGMTKNTNQSSYFKLYEGSFFVNFFRHEQILNIGLVELVNEITSMGNCMIEISDGNNIIVKEVGNVNNIEAKHTNIRIDCGFLSGNLKKWTITVYGRVQNGGIYTIRRMIVKSKPTTIACEDFIIQKTPNFNVSTSTYVQVDSFNFYGGYKVTSDTFLYTVIEYDVIGVVNSADIQLETQSGLATRTATTFIDTTKNIVEARVRCPATLENLIKLTMRAKINDGTGSINIKSYAVYLEM